MVRNSPENKVVVGLLSFLIVLSSFLIFSISGMVDMGLFFQFELKMVAYVARMKKNICEVINSWCFLRSVNFILMIFKKI